MGSSDNESVSQQDSNNPQFANNLLKPSNEASGKLSLIPEEQADPSPKVVFGGQSVSVHSDFERDE